MKAGVGEMREKSYDVVVCGCGVAGFCAAVAAARIGARTAVTEKYYMPGGTLTVGGNCSVDQFNNPYKAHNRQVIAGIGWELMQRLARQGFARIPDFDEPVRYPQQYGVKVNPIAAAAVMDEMLLQAGVTIYYGQPTVDVTVQNSPEGKKLHNIIIATKQGLCSLNAKVFIDATGDGDVSAWAGAQFEAGAQDGSFQPGTLRFYPSFSPVDQEDYVLDYGDNRNHITNMDTTDSDKLTQANIVGRRLLMQQLLKNRKTGDEVPMMACAPEVAPREGRRIKGRSVMTQQDYVSGKLYPDSVCYSFWYVDIHRDGCPTYHEYIVDGTTPAIRLSCMQVQGFSNLLTAGRCISADRGANSALRVKASCMAIGQAAGTAGALAAVNYGGLVAEVPINQVKEQLSAAGAIVPVAEQ